MNSFFDIIDYKDDVSENGQDNGDNDDKKQEIEKIDDDGKIEK